MGMNGKERLMHIKESLMALAEGQLHCLDKVDAEEYGEVIDMIKDMEEALYYCTITEAMGEKEPKTSWGHDESKMYMGYPMRYNDPWRYPDVMYADGRSMGNGSSNGGNSSNGNGNSGGNGTRYYSERELPLEVMHDHREGRSPRSRRMYMEAKETRQDKSTQMRELEKYMQELTQDLVEMIEDASPEEKQYLEKRLSVLASKVSQMNG